MIFSNEFIIFIVINNNFNTTRFFKNTVFKFEQPIKLEITSDGREEIKNVFYKIFNYIISDDFITFKFTRTEEDLYNDITEKYIQDFNNELEALKKNFANQTEDFKQNLQ